MSDTSGMMGTRSRRLRRLRVLRRGATFAAPVGPAG
jgi:hypothetical protein